MRLEDRRRYPMSRAEAWGLLADTDHLNRSIGLPPVEFSALPGPLLRGAHAKGAKRCRRRRPRRWTLTLIVIAIAAGPIMVLVTKL